MVKKPLNARFAKLGRGEACRDSAYVPSGVELALFCSSPPPVGVLCIVVPSGGIVVNVLADCIQFPFVADHTFVVIALPHPFVERGPSLFTQASNVGVGCVSQ